MRWLVALFGIVLGASPAAFDAVRNGDLAALGRALDAGASPNSVEAGGQTLLIHATVFLPVAGVRMLLERGADPNLPGKGGGTALMAGLGDLAKVRLLVERGARVDVRSTGGHTALGQALTLPAGRGVALYLMEHGAKPDGRELARVTRRGDMELLRAMLKAGAPVTEEAIRQALGNEPVLALYEAKAPEFRGDAVRRKALAEAVLSANGRTDLMYAAYYGRMDAVQTLLALGGDVNAKDNRGRTVLMHAAGSDHSRPEIVRLLLERGADPKAKDVRGDTALDIAQQRGKKEIVAALGGRLALMNDAELTETMRPVRESLSKANRLLEASGPEFFKLNGCISCHQQSIPQMVAGTLKRKGVAVSESVSKSQADAVTTLLQRNEANLWQSDCTIGGGVVATLSYDLVGLAADGNPRTRWTDLAAQCLIKMQAENGSFGVSDLRNPLGNGDAKYTALSLRGLLAYPLPGLREETAVRVARGAVYLESTTENDQQSLAFRILGLRWAGKPDRIPELTKQLMALQRANGGWAQHPEMPTDAFSTAIALLALHEGARLGDGAWQLGAAYLRRLQKEDGSWHVRSRGFGFQPYRETGFPYGHDQWLSSAATGYAVLALAPLISPE